MFVLDIYPGMGWLGFMVVLFLVFWEASVLFSTVAAPICILISSVWEFPFCHIFADICYLCSFDDSRSDRCDVILQFWFTFPWWLVLLSIFSCACWPSAFFLWKNIQFCQFLNQVFGVFIFWCWAIYICWVLTPYQLYHLHTFSHTQ